MKKACGWRKDFSYLILAAVAGIFILLSCKKETSCEGCNENNKPPIAIAGPDQVITLPTDSILLDGSASNDPDGTISEWLWTKVSGPASFTFFVARTARTIVKNLDTGVYQFELKVTDVGGLSSRDTIQIRVHKHLQNNRPPVANAGPDQTITLPVNTITADGGASTDPDNNITGYQWTKISGPSIYTLSNANAVLTQIIDLSAGNYLFELKVTDAGGLFAKDTMQVNVNSTNPTPTPPCSTCKIVFVSERDGNPEIYSCNSDGSNIARLTYDAGVDEQPAWSPDGTKIAFTSDRTGIPEIYLMNADGSNVVRKTFSASYSANPSWSPDGSKILYSTSSNGSSNIWVIDMISGISSLLFQAPGYDDQPSWSQDGTKIALVSDWMAYDFVYDIYTINADGSGFTALTGNIFDNNDYLSPAWSPVNSKLAVAITQRTGLDSYDTQVGVMNADGSQLITIASNAAQWTSTSWSPGGTMIAYTSLSGSGKNVSWVLADGTATGIIVTNGWNADWKH